MYNVNNGIHLEKIKPTKLYPLISLKAIDSNLLDSTISRIKKREIIPMVKAFKYYGDLYIIDGYYEMLAANLLNYDVIDVEIVDRKSIPIWKKSKEVTNTLKDIGRSALYDFEAVGDFKYNKYPKKYMEE